MTAQEAIATLNTMTPNGDREVQHIIADEILRAFSKSSSDEETRAVAAAYEAAEKRVGGFWMS